jgi:hypothetical protein
VYARIEKNHKAGEVVALPTSKSTQLCEFPKFQPRILTLQPFPPRHSPGSYFAALDPSCASSDPRASIALDLLAAGANLAARGGAKHSELHAAVAHLGRVAVQWSTVHVLDPAAPLPGPGAGLGAVWQAPVDACIVGAAACRAAARLAEHDGMRGLVLCFFDSLIFFLN